MTISRNINRKIFFSDILDANRGAGPGFDLLRFGLAVSILASHCSGLTGNGGFLSHFISDIYHSIVSLVHAAQLPAESVAATESAAQVVPRGVTGPARPYVLSRVPMFFALSGFLVMGSAFRTKKILPFLGLRIVRIVPALSVEVFLSAIVLGAIYTSLPIEEYFSSKEFHSYFLNIIGIVHYTLPGVFKENVSHTVNGNLWTLPAEFYSYLVVSILMIFGLLLNRRLFTLVFAFATLLLILANSVTGFGETQIGLDSYVTVYYFFTGVLFYLWKDKIVYNKYIFIFFLVVTYVVMLFPRTTFIYPTLLTYITLFIGLSSLPQFKLLKSGDYSYGIYLYGYPISQAIIASMPSIKHNLFGLLPLSILITAVFSVLSWHLVEKRFLRLKKYLSPKSAEISSALHPSVFADAEVREKPVLQGV